MAALAVGSVVGRYRVECMLGRGGMGVVYRAQAREGGARVALKVIAADLAHDPEFRARFHREAAAAASFEHPHVVPVLEAGEQEGLLYLAMRFVPGVDLATLIDRERLLSADASVRLVSQVASALDAAHSIGLVHRDVKPANVLVANWDRAREAHAYLTDFGVARRLQDRTRLTRPGFAVGTIDYLAPEALRGEGAGPAVDIYALGCVLFECLTGTPPFARDEELATVLAHLEDPPPPLASRAPGESAALERAVHRALAKHPDDRFASASALARAARAGLTAHAVGPAAPRTSRSGAARSPTAPLPGAPPPVSPREPVPTRKRVTLLFAVPELAPDLDPELRAVASTEFEQLARPVLERHGASIDNSPTGGLIGLFGLPVAGEDDAGRAVRAALALQAEVGAASGSEPGPVVVVATDVVIAGGQTPSSTTLSGLFELAFGMRQAAVGGDVHVSAATRQLAGDVADYELIADQPAVWRALPVRVSQAVATSGPAPLVGRQPELAALQCALAGVERERSSRLVSIVGDPGIGKSRLVAEFVSRARASATVTTARCRPRGEADVQEPLRELVNELVDGGSPSDLIRGDDADAIAERIERLLGRRAGDVPADELPWIVRRLLESAGQARPIVAVLEDIHWAHDPLLELVEYVAEWTRGTPLLFVCLTRPELLEHRPDWGEDAPDSRRIKLQALGTDDGNALLEGLPGASQLSPKLRGRILSAAEGNPLFLEQMVALMRDRPMAGDAITVPPSIGALLAARIDRLAAEERTTLAQAAVLGREFEADALDTLPSGSEQLPALVRKELVELVTGDGQERFRFRHALIRDAAYETLPMLVRAEMHERHAEWLQGRATASDESLGHHLERAYQYRSSLRPTDPENDSLARRAALALTRAGRRAFQRDDSPVAVGLLDRALALPAGDEPSRRTLRTLLGESLAHAGDFERAFEVLREAAREAHAAGDQVAEGRSLVQLAWVDMALGKADIGTLLDHVRGAIDLLQGHEDPQALAEAHMWLAELLRVQGRNEAAERELEAALAHARDVDDDRQMARILGLIDGCKMEGPAHVDELETHARYCLGWARGRVEGWFLEVSALRDLAWVHAVRGDFEEARVLMRQAKAALQNRGLGWFQAAYWTWVSEIELVADQPARAEQALHESYARCEKTGETSVMGSIAAWLAHAIAAQGDARLDEGLELTQRAENYTVRGDVHSEVSWRTARAVLLARREPQVAADLARAAIEVAAPTDYVGLQAHAQETLSRVCALAGDESEALAAATAAQQLYERKGYVAQATNIARHAERVERRRRAAGDLPDWAHS